MFSKCNDLVFDKLSVDAVISRFDSSRQALPPFSTLFDVQGPISSLGRMSSNSSNVKMPERPSFSIYSMERLAGSTWS
jgi:hypothetical protein